MLVQRNIQTTAIDEKIDLKVVKRLYKYQEVPAHSQNEFILDGYRICANFKESWKSLTYVHNETGNIFTHILASLVFVGILISVWQWDGPTFMDKVMFSVFCVCAIKCFLASTLFHLHSNQCLKTHNLFVCIDYSGISFMVMGSSMVVTYYLYYCNGLAQTIFLGFLTCLSLVGIVGSFVDYFKKHPVVRVYVFMATSFASAIPFLLYVAYNLKFPFYGINGFLGMLMMALFYIGGATIYAMRIPERYAPGIFDIWMHSHQWWHLFAFFAAISTYFLALDVYRWHQLENQCFAT